MLIRTGQLKDLNPLLKLLNATPELQAGIKKTTYDSNFVKIFLTDKKAYLTLIAEENKKIVGFLMAEMFQKRRQSFLVDLFVLPECRKIGVAAELRKRYNTECKKLQIKRIQCLVLVTNKRMQSYIEKRGYKRGHAFYFYEKML